VVLEITRQPALRREIRAPFASVADAPGAQVRRVGIGEGSNTVAEGKPDVVVICVAPLAGRGAADTSV
jgi:hypothetical protein